MTQCHCPDCAALPAPTYSREFLLATEARQVLKWDRERRTAYFRLVLEKRGKKRANELIAAVNVERDGLPR